jgi:hypothetical protein
MTPRIREHLCKLFIYGLILIIYKELQKLNIKRTNNPIISGQVNWAVLIKRSTNG